MSTNLAEAFNIEVSATQEAETPQLHAVAGYEGELELSPPQGVLSVVPDCPNTSGKNTIFKSADSIPELYYRRQRARQHATRTLALNSYLLHNGRSEEVPTAVDALGTARQVVETKEQFGENSPEHKEVFGGLKLDNERLVGEAANRKGKRYFEPVSRTFKSEDDGYFSHGLSISRIIRNGLSPLAHPEEQPRRVIEDVEENGTLVPIGSMIAKLGLQKTVEQLSIPITSEAELPKISIEVTTMSRCPDYAIREYAINPKGSHSGYRPAVDGMVIRRSHYDNDSGDREDEMVMISGIYINQKVIEAVLVDKGVIEEGQNLSTDELLALQIISVNGGSVMEFIRELDNKASEIHGLNIFMGEEVPADHPKNYYEFMEESEEQRKQLEPVSLELAEFQVGLEEGGTDNKVADALVSRFVKEKLIEIAKRNPDLAEGIFDKQTALGLNEVVRLEVAGKYTEAKWLQTTVEKNAPEVSFCGSDDCEGLEAVDPSSTIGQLAIGLGLKGTMVHNKVASCKDCHEKKLIHDLYNNTICAGCEATKLSGQDVKHGRKGRTEPEGKQSVEKTIGGAKIISLDKVRKEKKNRPSARRRVTGSRENGQVIPLFSSKASKQPQAN